MHNGSLQDALIGRKCPELAAWGRRLAVALDVARGLEFLHFACEPPVVHGDIKPSNILLDVHFSAKIADVFGLARVLTPAAAIPALEDDASVTIADDLSTTAAETESTTTTALDETNNCLNTPAARMRLVNGGDYGVASAVAGEVSASGGGSGSRAEARRPQAETGGGGRISLTLLTEGPPWRPLTPPCSIEIIRRRSRCSAVVEPIFTTAKVLPV